MENSSWEEYTDASQMDNTWVLRVEKDLFNFDWWKFNVQ